MMIPSLIVGVGSMRIVRGIAFSEMIARLLPPEDGRLDIPLPVILDANLRFRLDSKLMNNYKMGKGRQPTIFTSADLLEHDNQFEERRKMLEDGGVKVVPIPSTDGKLPPSDLQS